MTGAVLKNFEALVPCLLGLRNVCDRLEEDLGEGFQTSYFCSRLVR